MQKLSELIAASKRVYIIGNGGSHANADHICNDLNSCWIKAFTINPATFSAFSNDFGYEHAYARWISIVGEPGDLLIALSGSGKSPNILNAVKQALMQGMTVWEEYGARQGCDMQSSEEKQLWLGHEVLRDFKRKIDSF